MTKTLANIVCKRKVLNWPADKVGKYVLQSLPKWALLDTLGQQHAHWTYEVVLWKSKRALIFPPFIWYFLCKITTFLDVLVKTTHCSQRRFKGKQNHKRMWKKKKAIRREKTWAKIRLELFRQMLQLSFVIDWKISFREVLCEKTLHSTGCHIAARNYAPRLTALFVSTPGKELSCLSTRGTYIFGLRAINTLLWFPHA